MEPFRVAFGDDMVEDLRARLKGARIPESIAGAPWEHGTDAEYLGDLVRVWAEEFDWAAAQRRLNEFPQFTVRIEGMEVHFVHVPARPGPGEAIPIILTHGWPYSYLEMLKIVPHLTDPLSTGGEAGDRFDVVIPSLPGFGFSDPFVDEPFLSRTVAAMWDRLMTRVLGYERYAIYGEDVGAPISDWTAALYPERVIGLHATHPAFPPDERRKDLTEEERAFVDKLTGKWSGEAAYSEIQATKPNTLAVGLNDSPAGLLSWIVEKLRAWSGGDGGFQAAWTVDEILTLVTLYWMTGTIGSSFRSYLDGRLEPPLPPIEVPVGVSVQYGEHGFPRSYAERTYRDIRFWNDLPEGGHFTVKQSPELVATDMRTFFRPLRRE